MTTKSTTQKLNIRWQDRSWQPEIRQVTGAGKPDTGGVAPCRSEVASSSVAGRRRTASGRDCRRTARRTLRLLHDLFLNPTNRRKSRAPHKRIDL